MKPFHLFLSIFAAGTLLFSCQKTAQNNEFKTGFWRGEITIQNQQLPFVFEVVKSEEKYTINLHDGDNTIELDEVTVKNDSVFFTMHIFDIDVKAKINENSIVGTYTKNYANNYVLPFKATFGKKNRLDAAKSDTDFNGKWSFQFEKDTEDNKKIAIFKTEDNILKATILTKTGDYRYLEGTSENGKFTLYSFDGNHLYIFKGQLDDKNTLTGKYWSGKTAHKKFKAIRNENAKLPDANSLTYLKEGYDKIKFSFPDLEGNLVTLSDAKYQNKVVILQIFGTWCPNCMDETIFYAEWFEKNKHRGVEIIGLAYENKDDFEYAKKRVQKMKDRLNANYDFVIAGTSKRGDASRSLPMLNKVMSFPTSIIIDKKGTVRSIHTGFSGPATGDYYMHYIEEFNALMDTLLLE